MQVESHNKNMIGMIGRSFKPLKIYRVNTGNQGRGFYMSPDRMALQRNGPYCTVNIVAAGALLFDSSNITALGKSSLTQRETDLLGAVVPFLQVISGPLWTTHHIKMLSNAVSGLSVQPTIWVDTTMNEQMFWHNLDELRQYVTSGQASRRMQDQVGWFDSFVALFFYIDSIAFSRNIRVNPNNPWHEFEPENFETFKQTRSYLLEVLAERQHPGVSKNGIMGQGWEKKSWAANQKNVVIPKLWSSIAGITDKNITLRTWEVRGGGDDKPHKTFLVPATELKALQDNVYLEVEVWPNGNDYEVAYYYPDANHFKGVAKRGYITPQLTAELIRYENDTTQFPRLTQKILDQLLDNLFERWHGEKYDDMFQIAKFMVEFVSIHPYGDYNGRTTRMYAHLAAYESAVGLDNTYKLPHEYISDFDTVFPLKKYGQFMKDGSENIVALMVELMKEMIESDGMRRPAKYYDLPGWINLQKSLYMFGLKHTAPFDAVDDSFIEHRQFTQLLNKIIGPKWGDSLAN